MFCPFCGTTVSNDAVFCPKCGANLRQERQIINGEERPRPHIAEERENAVPSSRQTFTTAAEPAQAQDKKQGKKPPNKALIAILASVGVIVLLALFILVRQMSAPLNPTGIRTLDTYDNSYFDFSFDRQDGFAFASDEEIARIGNLVSDLELDDELDNGQMDDSVNPFVVDVVCYNPAAGDALVVAVSRPEIPSSVSDQELLDSMGKGVLNSLQYHVGGFPIENGEVQIANTQCPCIRSSGEVLQNQFFVQSALMRVNNRVAIIAGASLNEQRLEDMFAQIVPSVGLTEDRSDLDQTTSDNNGDLSSYTPGTRDGNTYTNEHFGITCTFPDDYTFPEVEDASTSFDSLLGDAKSNPFASEIQMELVAGSTTTIESIVFISQNRPTSYAQTYTDEQIAEFSIRDLDNNIYENSLAQNGMTDVHTEKKNYTVGDKQYPALFSSGKIQGISVCTAYTCIAKDTEVMCIFIVTVDESRIPEFLSLINYS